MRLTYYMRYYSSFPRAIPHLWAGYSRVTRPSATVHFNLHSEEIKLKFLVRLACVRHAASVRPEPGSNSRSIVILKPIGFLYTLLILADFSFVLLEFPNFLFVKNSLVIDFVHLMHFQELTLFIFQCTNLFCRSLIDSY